VWLVLAVGLAVAELHNGDFTLLMLSGGCVLGFAASLIFPVFWIQVVVAVIAGALLLWLLRPTLLHRVRSMPGYRSSLDRMVGSTGVTTRAITASDGEVKINGEVWSARSMEGSPIALDTLIDVYGIDGTYLLVAPQSVLPPSYAPMDPFPASDPPPTVDPFAAGPGFGTIPRTSEPPADPPPTGDGATRDVPDYWSRPQA
jgi:membrane protein implicated in regulation of membrane protease activity